MKRLGIDIDFHIDMVKMEIETIKKLNQGKPKSNTVWHLERSLERLGKIKESYNEIMGVA